MGDENRSVNSASRVVPVSSRGARAATSASDSMHAWSGSSSPVDTPTIDATPPADLDAATAWRQTGLRLVNMTAPPAAAMSVAVAELPPADTH